MLDKSKLFRFGPSFKGYEVPGATEQEPQGAPKPPTTGARDPLMWPCRTCGRKVSAVDGKYVNHYQYAPGPTAPNPNVKCPESSRPVYRRPDTPPPGGQSNWGRPPPPPGGSSSSQQSPGQGATGDSGTRRYFTFISGNSRKFWEIEYVSRFTLKFRWGRI